MELGTLTAVLVLALGSQSPLTKQSLAVPDLQAAKPIESVASAVADALATQFARTQLFEVSSASQVRALLGLERQRQLLGDQASGASTIGNLLKVDYLLTGRLTRLTSGDFTLDVALLETATSNRVSSASVNAATDLALLGELPALVAKLTAPLAAKRQGFVAVRSPEKGALVKLDDSAMGVTPLPGRLRAPAGLRFVTVEKEGFTTWRQEVAVQPEAVSEIDARLVPSPDFIRGYEGRQRLLRIGAYSSSALAAVGLGVGIGLFVNAQGMYGSPTSANSFLFHREQLASGVELEGSIDHRAESERLKSQIELNRNLSVVAFAVAGASAIAATVFWVLSDDGDKYAPFREIEISPGGVRGAF